MMRATYAVLLVGTLLAGTMLVPFDEATQRGRPRAYPYAQPFMPLQEATKVPPGKTLVPFPDLWDGATSLTIYENRVYVPGSLGLAASAVELRLPAGNRVLPGAQWLNVTLQTSPSAEEPSLDFEYTSADDRRALRAIQHDQPFSVELEEPMNDWSPDPLTRWMFKVHSSGSQGVEAKIRITIAREAGPLPPHVFVADRWANQDTRVVFDQKDRLHHAAVSRQSLPLPENKGPTTLAALRNVPATELQELRVHLHYNSSTPNDLHFRPLLSWNSPRSHSTGDDRTSVPPDDEKRGTTGRFMWRVPVTQEMFDNLLGSRSRWQLSVNWYGNSTDTQEYYMEGDFHFQVVAHRGVVDLGPTTRRT